MYANVLIIIYETGFDKEVLESVSTQLPGAEHNSSVDLHRGALITR